MFFPAQGFSGHKSFQRILSFEMVLKITWLENHMHYMTVLTCLNYVVAKSLDCTVIGASRGRQETELTCLNYVVAKSVDCTVIGPSRGRQEP